MSLLKLRPPEFNDLPPIFSLVEDHKHKFLNDYAAVTIGDLQNILDDPHTLIIDDEGYPVGAFQFANTCDDLHTTIHFLVRPEYLKFLLKQKLCARALDHAFQVIGVQRVYAYPTDQQKSAIRLLKKHHFYSHLPWRSHTKKNGKKVDTIFMELKNSIWEKNKNVVR